MTELIFYIHHEKGSKDPGVCSVFFRYTVKVLELTSSCFRSLRGTQYGIWYTKRLQSAYRCFPENVLCLSCRVGAGQMMEETARQAWSWESTEQNWGENAYSGQTPWTPKDPCLIFISCIIPWCCVPWMVYVTESRQQSEAMTLLTFGYKRQKCC